MTGVGCRIPDLRVHRRRGRIALARAGGLSDLRLPDHYLRADAAPRPDGARPLPGLHRVQDDPHRPHAICISFGNRLVSRSRPLALPIPAQPNAASQPTVEAQAWTGERDRERSPSQNAGPHGPGRGKTVPPPRFTLAQRNGDTQRGWTPPVNACHGGTRQPASSSFSASATRSQRVAAALRDIESGGG